MTHRPTRLLLLPAMVLAAVLAVSGCAATTAAPAAAPPSATSRTFTDDLGRTVTLDGTRVAGLTDVLYSLISYGLEPVAAFGYSGVAKDVRFDDLDTTGLAEVGTTYGEINVEALAAAAPDVIVTHVYPTDSSGTIDATKPLYGFADLEQQAKVEQIAPIVAIRMAGNAADVIRRTTELAVALGASPDSGPVAEGRSAFETASAALTAAADPDITTQVIYGEAANVYVAKPADDPSLSLYASLGMRFVAAKTEDYYWDVISWEDYDTIGGDLVLYSERGFGPKELAEQPTFAAGAAAKAGQVHPWVFAGMDYVTQAAYLTQLAAHLSAAKDVA